MPCDAAGDDRSRGRADAGPSGRRVLASSARRRHRGRVFASSDCRRWARGPASGRGGRRRLATRLDLLVKPPRAPSCGRRRCDTTRRRGSSSRPGSRAPRPAPSPAAADCAVTRRARMVEPPLSIRAIPEDAIGWCRARRLGRRPRPHATSTEASSHPEHPPTRHHRLRLCLAQRSGACATLAVSLTELHDPGAGRRRVPRRRPPRAFCLSVPGAVRRGFLRPPMSAEAVARMIELRAQGLGFKRIARAVGCAPITVPRYPRTESRSGAPCWGRHSGSDHDPGGIRFPRFTQIRHLCSHKRHRPYRQPVHKKNTPPGLGSPSNAHNNDTKSSTDERSGSNPAAALSRLHSCVSSLPGRSSRSAR